MKLHLASSGALRVITGRGKGFVAVDGERYDASLIVTPKAVIAAWPPRTAADLRAAHFVQIVELKPDVVLIGTGEALVFPAREVLLPLIEAVIGFEVMDLAAACRTYNVLLHEGRNVAAALILS